VLEGLRVGDARVTLRFDRDGDDGRAVHRVLRREGTLRVVDAPPPADVDGGGLRDRVERWLLRRAPGRRAGAARIAVGLGGDRRRPG
jgi:hypothetical protein